MSDDREKLDVLERTLKALALEGTTRAVLVIVHADNRVETQAANLSEDAIPKLLRWCVDQSQTTSEHLNLRTGRDYSKGVN